MSNAAFEMVRFCLSHPDECVLAFTYTDKQGVVTDRIVSPHKMLSDAAFQAMCLKRADVRTFDLTRCKGMKIGLACDAMVEGIEPEPKPKEDFDVPF